MDWRGRVYGRNGDVSHQAKQFTDSEMERLEKGVKIPNFELPRKTRQAHAGIRSMAAPPQ